MNQNISSDNGVTSVTGYTFVSSVIEPYHVSKIDAETIYELTNNLYVVGPVTQTTNLVIAGAPTIEVYDEKGDPVEDLSRELNTMFSQPSCSLSAVSRSAMKDLMNWGISLYNWVWQRDDIGRLICTALNRIHPYNLSVRPSGGSTGKTYGRVLPGIVYDRDDRSVHYYHRQDSGTPFEIPEKDLLVIRDSACDYPDGNSVIYPIAPIIEFINYSWNALGQQMYRTGAPIIFIKITNPNPERIVNGEKIQSDVDYAREFMANWGKDTAFPLRENFEIISIDVKEGTLAVRAIDFAQNTIRDYLNPNGMLGKDGALISGNSDASLRLLNNSIKGWITLLETSLSEIPNYYLRHNGYPDTYHAAVRIPHSVVEDQSMKLQQAQLGASTHTLTVNEVRELLGREGLSDEELAGIIQEWNLVTPPTPSTTPSSIMFSSPNWSSYAKRRAVADECDNQISNATDELERLIHAAIRSEMEGDNETRNS